MLVTELVESSGSSQIMCSTVQWVSEGECFAFYSSVHWLLNVICPSLTASYLALHRQSSENIKLEIGVWWS